MAKKTPQVEKPTTSENRKQNIIIHLPSLQACLAFASRDKTRAYLTGVYVHPRKNEGTCYVATDGHRLCLAIPDRRHTGSAEGVFGKHDEEHKSYILNPSDCAELIRWWDKKTHLAVGKMARIEVDGQKLTAYSWDGRMSMKLTPIDATYPYYDRAIPSETAKVSSPVPFGLNMSYLAELKKVGALFSHPKTMSSEVHFYGPSDPVKFLMRNPDGDKAVCVIMPMRL